MTDCDNLYERAKAQADVDLLKKMEPCVAILQKKLTQLGITATIDPRTATADSCGVRYYGSNDSYSKRPKPHVNASVICPHPDKTSEYHTELHQRSAHSVDTVADLVLVLETARECAAYQTPTEKAKSWWQSGPLRIRSSK